MKKKRKVDRNLIERGTPFRRLCSPAAAALWERGRRGMTRAFFTTISNLNSRNMDQGICAAKAFYSCPAIISRRPESQNTSKEPHLKTEEESKIIQARSHITLEKSSINYKPSEE